MCRNTHPSARARALASPTTTCHQEALQVIQPVNRCRSTNRCPVAIVEGGDELVTAELVRRQSLTALDQRLPVVGGELGVDPAEQPPRLATHACTRSGASQDEGSTDGPPVSFTSPNAHPKTGTSRCLLPQPQWRPPPVTRRHSKSYEPL